MENPTLLHRRAATIVAAALSTGGTILTTGASATVSVTNSVRRQAGQSPLTWDDSLAKAAQAWADAPASTAGGSLHHACC